MAEKVVFPSFRDDTFTGFDMRQLVSALEYRFTSIETELTETTVASGGPFAPLVHQHVESDITDLQAYLLNITSESIFDLSDVSGTPAVNNVLRWNGSAFVPAAVGATINLNDLANVSVPAPSDGHHLVFNSLSGVWEAVAAGATLTTDLTGQAEYDLLYNEGGTTWHDTAGELIWNPDFDYLQLANAHSINWRDSGFITKQLLELTSGDVFEVGHDSHVLQLKGSFVQTNDALRVYDSGNTDFGSQSHDGTDYNWAFTNTTDLNITGLTSIQAGTVDVDFDAITATSYGGIDEANLLDKTATETVSGQYTFSANEITFTGNNGPVIQNAQPELFIRETDALTDEGNWMIRANSGVMSFFNADDASPTAGVNAFIQARRSGTVVTDLEFSPSTRVEIKGATLRVEDSTGSDWLDAAHDGTDFNFDFTNTTDLNITGITAIAAGAVNADFDALTATSYGGILEANLLDKTATESISGSYTFTSLTDFAGGPGTGVRVRDGGLLRVQDSTDTDYAQFQHDGTDFNTTFVNTTDWNIGSAALDRVRFQVTTDTGIIDIINGATLRIWDSTTTDRVALQHDGTDFNFTFTNTTDVHFTGASNEYVFVENGSAVVRIGGNGGGNTNELILGKGFNADSGISWDRAGTIDTRIYFDAAEDLYFSLDHSSVLGAAFAAFQFQGTTFLSIENDLTNTSLTFASTTNANFVGATNYVFDSELIAVSGGGQSAPKIRFDNATQTGLYSNTANELSISANGSRQMLITDGDVRIDNSLSVDDAVYISERAAADADIAGQGQIWVRNDTPNTLMFTDDAGADHDLTAAGGSQTPWTSDIDGGGFGLDNIDRLEVQDSGGTDSITITHNGTDVTFDYTNTTWQRFTGIGSGWLFQDGGELRVYDSGDTDYIGISNDGSNAFIAASASSGNFHLRVNGIENAIVMTKNFGVTLYYDNTAHLATQQQGTADQTSGAYVVDGNGTARDIGFNLFPQVVVNSTTTPFTVQRVGYDIISDNATAYTWTTYASANANNLSIPIGAAWKLTNLGSGNITIAAGTSVTLRWMNGTSSTGSRTLAQYGTATLYKYTESIYHIWGSGLT